jgi:hypothetical protein
MTTTADNGRRTTDNDNDDNNNNADKKQTHTHNNQTVHTRQFFGGKRKGAEDTMLGDQAVDDTTRDEVGRRGRSDDEQHEERETRLRTT